ncbi:uncharacterized protein LOC128245020 [Mya arenaria]|uniref:uncharacterized protein LOC128245020 n=1 Tax=Mya arenaria TaxID=6604 RepID=UPI0022E61ABF|nr:uncharacterized protein LOC128245020 [Mya arenaria]
MDTRICLLLLFTISQCIALECSSCMHMDFEYINMPEYIESLLNDMMSSLDSLRNESCASNTAPTETCAVAGPGLIDACASFTFTVTCMGFTAANLPDTGMKITVVTRECIPQPADTEDTCRKIDSLLDAENQTEFLSSLESLTEAFDSVEYNGDYCTTSTGIFPTSNSVTATTPKITTEPTSGSSTTGFMSSVAVLVIALYLV